jgi:hypothetical protein
MTARFNVLLLRPRRTGPEQARTATALTHKARASLVLIETSAGDDPRGPSCGRHRLLQPLAKRACSDTLAVLDALVRAGVVRTSADKLARGAERWCPRRGRVRSGRPAGPEQRRSAAEQGRRGTRWAQTRCGNATGAVGATRGLFAFRLRGRSPLRLSRSESRPIDLSSEAIGRASPGPTLPLSSPRSPTASTRAPDRRCGRHLGGVGVRVADLVQARRARRALPLSPVSERTECRGPGVRGAIRAAGLPLSRLDRPRCGLRRRR